MAKLTKYRLIKVDGNDRLVTRHGDRDIDEVDDAFAEKLFKDGSAFVEKIETPESKPKSTP